MQSIVTRADGEIPAENGQVSASLEAFHALLGGVGVAFHTAAGARNTAAAGDNIQRARYLGGVLVSGARGTLMTQVQEIAIPVLLVWLLLETVWNLKDRDIPRWFSIIPLAAGLIHLVWAGNWLAAVLMLFSILGTHITHSGRYVVVAAPIIFLAFLPEILPLAIGWVLLYLAWELGWFGGADALAGAYLLIWFPGWEMLIGIVLGIIIWNLALAMKMFGKQAGLQIWSRVSAGMKGLKTPGLGAFLLVVHLYYLQATYL